MTWEADIVARAGKLSISGQFKISSESEYQLFIAKLKELAAKSFKKNCIAGIKPVEDQPIQRPTIKDEVIEKRYSLSIYGGRPQKPLPKNIPNSVTLTLQEKSVFDLYHAGLSREKICERLKITSSAVTHYLSTVRRKIERASQ